MDFEKIISERFSVRSFKPEHLSADVLNKILEAGHKAPTGCNYQPQRILVLNTDEAMEKLKICTKCHFNAPAALVICHNEEESWKRVYDGALSSSVDAVIVATYMMLAAQNEGVGCCWVMHFNPEKLCEEFKIPENIKPVSILIMGEPDDDAKPFEMHYKFRPIEETVVFDSF